MNRLVDSRVGNETQPICNHTTYCLILDLVELSDIVIKSVLSHFEMFLLIIYLFNLDFKSKGSCSISLVRYGRPVIFSVGIPVLVVIRVTVGCHFILRISSIELEPNVAFCVFEIVLLLPLVQNKRYYSNVNFYTVLQKPLYE